jgi:hypothetical protein
MVEFPSIEHAKAWYDSSGGQLRYTMTATAPEPIAFMRNTGNPVSIELQKTCHRGADGQETRIVDRYLVYYAVTIHNHRNRTEFATVLRYGQQCCAMSDDEAVDRGDRAARNMIAHSREPSLPSPWS